MKTSRLALFLEEGKARTSRTLVIGMAVLKCNKIVHLHHQCPQCPYNISANQNGNPSDPLSEDLQIRHLLRKFDLGHLWTTSRKGNVTRKLLSRSNSSRELQHLDGRLRICPDIRMRTHCPILSRRFRMAPKYRSVASRPSSRSSNKRSKPSKSCLHKFSNSRNRSSKLNLRALL
jgi:hypothetical protein